MNPAELSREHVFRAVLRRSVLVPVLLMVVIAIVLAWASGRLLLNEDLVRQSDEVISRANECLRLGIDMETGVRGYQLTHDAAFLEPYRAAGRAIEAEFAHLDRLVDTPEQLRRLDRVRVAHAAWVGFGTEIIARAQRGETVTGTRLNREGKELFDTFRQRFAAFVTGEQQLKQARVATLERTDRRLLQGRVAIFCVSALVLALYMRRQLQTVAAMYGASEAAARRQAAAAEASAKDLAKARDELATLNTSLEQRVKDATAELRDLNGELETYVATVTHDLRSPLRTIEGMASVLLEESVPPDERRQVIERIVARAAHLQQLIQDLLDYSRIKQREIKLRPVELATIVAHATQRVADEASESGAVIDVAPRLPRVLGVETVLAQALANLLSNAMKFVREGVRPHVVVTAEIAGSIVRVLVRDNGIGIPASDQGKLFRVFERLGNAAKYPGTGVGLAMVQRAVQKMGGRLGVCSEPDEGSTFWIELPRA